MLLEVMRLAKYGYDGVKVTMNGKPIMALKTAAAAKKMAYRLNKLSPHYRRSAK